jgi:hypothetical protein
MSKLFMQAASIQVNDEKMGMPVTHACLEQALILAVMRNAFNINLLPISPVKYPCDKFPLLYNTTYDNLQQALYVLSKNNCVTIKESMKECQSIMTAMKIVLWSELVFIIHLSNMLLLTKSYINLPVMVIIMHQYPIMLLVRNQMKTTTWSMGRLRHCSTKKITQLPMEMKTT